MVITISVSNRVNNDRYKSRHQNYRDNHNGTAELDTSLVLLQIMEELAGLCSVTRLLLLSDDLEVLDLRYLRATVLMVS